MIRGYLYKKLFDKKAVPAGSRTTRMLEIMRQRHGVPAGGFMIMPSARLINLPDSDSIKKTGVIYPLIKPYSYASIKWDDKEDILLYTVVEPVLTDAEKQIFEKLKEGLMQVIDVDIERLGREDTAIEFLENNISYLIDQYGLSITRQQHIKIMYYVFRDFVGLNEIEPLLRDPYIEDIGLDGTGVPVYIVHQKYGSMKTSIAISDDKALREFIIKLSERCNRYISYAEPLLDGSLPDGTRVQASIASDVTTRGPTFSIRKFREVPFTPAELIVKYNTASPDIMAYLWFVMEHGANILIAGGVASGKTSMLNSVSLFIPPEAKIVSIEDTKELSLPHENWIPGVARAGFAGSGVGEVTMFDLLRESFRQNPDYLIVGEIRGKEAYVLFQAMSSGHPSISTIHAGSVDDVMKRLQTNPISLSAGLLEALDIVIIMIHARDKGKSARRIKEIVEIESIDAQTQRARTSKIFVWLPSSDTFEYRGNSWLLSKISSEKGIPMDEIMREVSRRKRVINWLIQTNRMSMEDVSKHIELYYRNPGTFEQEAGVA